MGARFTVLWASLPCGPTGWLALLLINSGDVETNPCRTTSHKRVWICAICYKQIHVRTQIPIRCNRIEHWVHLICTGIRQAQYTDPWTCHLHRESRPTFHTDITPPHPSRPWSMPPTHHPHHRNPNHTHIQHAPCSDRIGKAQTQSSQPPPPPHTRPRAKHISHTSPTPLIHSTSAAQDTCTTHRTSSIPHTSIAVTLSQHTHMQHKQQYTHHSHINHRMNIVYHDNLTDRPKTTT